MPNFEWTHHQFEAHHFGIRGLIGDREDKYLMLVNGRVMNERTHFGALSERDLVLMGDLREVSVIRGPGSAIYGPGAVLGVINQETYSGLTFQGSELTARGGVFEEFASLEFKHGSKSDDDSGWFFYGGLAEYSGADRKYAPIIQGLNWTSPDYGDVRAGEPLPFGYTDYKEPYRDMPQLKLHAQVDFDGLTLWTRYSQNSEILAPTDRGPYAPPPVGTDDVFPNPPQPAGSLPPPDTAIAYQQWVSFLGYKRELGENVELEMSTSFDMTTYERMIWDNLADSHLERKSLSKALLRWDMSEHHQFAFGGEFGYYWLGRPSWLSPGANGISQDLGAPQEWETYMASVLAEHQWRVDDRLTLVISARADKHKYTDWLFSPRGAVIYGLTDRDTLKFIASQSLRTTTEEAMRENWLNGNVSEAEQMKTLELRYERQHSDHLFFAASAFYNSLDSVSWNDTLRMQQNVGSYDTAGVEFEGRYRTGDTTVTLSHGFTKLVAQDFDTTTGTIITAAPYGYGYDLNNWSNHITKFSVYHQMTPKWAASGSLRVYWGFDGDENWLAYKNDNPFLPRMPGSSEEGWDEPYGPSIYLNLGLEHKIHDNATLRFDAYNVLGWVDQTLNKRDTMGGIWEGAYRVEPPALGVTLRMTF